MTQSEQTELRRRLDACLRRCRSDDEAVAWLLRELAQAEALRQRSSADLREVAARLAEAAAAAPPEGS